VAHHILTGIKVAIKVLNKSKIKTPDMSEKVKREMNILNMCSHPHIYRLYVCIF
jgi:5'-AMP-activated protein kinase catalytic alpha subunit